MPGATAFDHHTLPEVPGDLHDMFDHDFDCLMEDLDRCDHVGSSTGWVDQHDPAHHWGGPGQQPGQTCQRASFDHVGQQQQQQQPGRQQQQLQGASHSPLMASSSSHVTATATSGGSGGVGVGFTGNGPTRPFGGDAVECCSRETFASPFATAQGPPGKGG